MERFKVRIHIETSARGPGIKVKGTYGWVVEYALRNREITTREGFKTIKTTTENQLVLLALNDAISILNKPCSILVFTKGRQVLNVFQNGWQVRWKLDGWVNAKGKKIKHVEEWIKLDELLEEHTILFTSEESSYSEWLKKEIEKQEETNHV